MMVTSAALASVDVQVAITAGNVELNALALVARHWAFSDLQFFNAAGFSAIS